jgi:4-amino-4-deoxy-L-arabinose transferase-like glycosyltransferase
MADSPVAIRRLNWVVYKPAVVLTLLVGAFLRFWNLTAVGLEHDEVANWLIDRSILAGKHAIYFQEAYGHEAGFHYLQTLSVALIGDHALALRLPAALLGVVLIAVSYTLVKQLYNRQIALVAAVILAVTFFPVFYSRLALRAIMLPVFSGLAGYFYWRGKGQGSAIEPRFYLLAGIFAGLATYTYMASRVVPIFFALFFAYLFISQRNHLRFTFYILFPYLLISAPLFIYLWINPAAEFRISEINYPLEQLRQLNVRPVLENTWRMVGVWGWRGDPLWRQNVAGEAIFSTWYIAALFYAGIAYLLWRRQARDLFVLLWLATATIPSIVTVDAPSTIRMINLLPLLGVPIGVAYWQIIRLMGFPRLWQIAMGLFFIAQIGRTTEMIFDVWPQNAEVQFVWQQSLTSMAGWLEMEPALHDVTILGWTPDTMDAPTMQLALRRDDVALRFAGRDGGVVEAVVVPAGDRSAVLRPDTPTLPLHPALEQILPTNYLFDDFSFHQFVLPRDLSAENTPFGNQWQLIGNTLCVMDASVCHFATVWEVSAANKIPQSVFVHVVDGAGEVVSQSDVRLNGRASWRVGDLVLVGHTLDLENAAEIRTGIYHSDPPFVRLLTPTGQDSERLSVESR